MEILRNDIYQMYPLLQGSKLVRAFERNAFKNILGVDRCPAGSLNMASKFQNIHENFVFISSVCVQQLSSQQMKKVCFI